MVEAGYCPLCHGTGKLQPGVICAHDPGTAPLHHEGDECDLCHGTGTPPPTPAPTDLNGMRGFHSR
jgi:hypothetical protein